MKHRSSQNYRKSQAFADSAAAPPLANLSSFGLSDLDLAQGLVRVAEIAGPGGFLPIGRSTWYDWVARKQVKPGIKLSYGVTVWPRAYIHHLIADLAAQGGHHE